MAFFNDWQQPRPPAPRRLSLDDLLGMQQQFQPTPRPQPMRGVADLDQQGRRDVRQQSVIQGLAALGASMQTNDWRYAGQGAADIAGMQQQAVGDANARAEQEWQAEQERRAQEIEQEQKRGQQAALFGVYDNIAQAEPPGSRLTEEAETAARAGSMSQLQEILTVKQPKWAAARGKGYNPELWDTSDRMQADLKAELDRQQAAAAWEEEQKRLAEKEAIENEAELNARIAQRDKGVLWEPRESPAEAAARARAVAEAQEGVRAKYRTDEAGGPFAGGRLFEQGKQIVYAIPPSEANPQGQVIPLQGAPKNSGDIVYFMLPGGVRMMQDTSRPDLPAVEVPKVRAGQAGYESAYRQTVDGAPAAPPPPRPEPTPQERAEALGVRNNLTLSFERGADPAEAEALLRRRYPNGVGGFSIERIMAEAQAQAARRKRGGRP